MKVEKENNNRKLTGVYPIFTGSPKPKSIYYNKKVREKKRKKKASWKLLHIH